MSKRVKAWSWSAYSLWSMCPAKYKYEKLDKLPQPPNPAFDKGNKWHKLAEDFLKGDIDPLPPQLKRFKTQFHELRDIVSFVESSWAFTVDWKKTSPTNWNNCWLRAKADAGVIFEDNTAFIIDHKTGKKYGENEDQMELFALCGMYEYPTVTDVKTFLWYLEVDDPSQNEVVREFSAKDKEKLRAKWEKKVAPMFADTRFSPKPNDKCFFCNFSKEKGGPCRF